MDCVVLLLHFAALCCRWLLLLLPSYLTPMENHEEKKRDEAEAEGRSRRRSAKNDLQALLLRQREAQIEVEMLREEGRERSHEHRLLGQHKVQHAQRCECLLRAVAALHAFR